MGTEDIQNILNTSVGEVSVGAIISGIIALVICLFAIRIVTKMIKKVLYKRFTFKKLLIPILAKHLPDILLQEHIKAMQLLLVQKNLEKLLWI